MKNTYFVAQVFMHCLSQCFIFLCVCFPVEPEKLSLDGGCKFPTRKPEIYAKHESSVTVVAGSEPEKCMNIKIQHNLQPTACMCFRSVIASHIKR